jgi:hypothetical protein
LLNVTGPQLPLFSTNQNLGIFILLTLSITSIYPIILNIDETSAAGCSATNNQCIYSLPDSLLEDLNIFQNKYPKHSSLLPKK